MVLYKIVSFLLQIEIKMVYRFELRINMKFEHVLCDVLMSRFCTAQKSSCGRINSRASFYLAERKPLSKIKSKHLTENRTI